jgi:hypothetical protein
MINKAKAIKYEIRFDIDSTRILGTFLQYHAAKKSAEAVKITSLNTKVLDRVEKQ